MFFFFVAKLTGPGFVTRPKMPIFCCKLARQGRGNRLRISVAERLQRVLRVLATAVQLLYDVGVRHPSPRKTRGENGERPHLSPGASLLHVVVLSLNTNK